MADVMVLKTQQWLNTTYGGVTGYGSNIAEDGITGTNTVNALLRAFQIELGITNTANSFGATTISKFNSRFPNGIKQQNGDDETEDNVYAIIQGACWCKGYSVGSQEITKHFYSGTGNAIKNLKSDAGCSETSSTITLNVMKALLTMTYFVCGNTGDSNIRTMQQYLNNNYESYIGLSPCDGVYGRDTNKALIYAIQAEEGLSTSVANGNFGVSTKKYCPTIPYLGIEKNSSGNVYSNTKISKFINILNFALYANGFGNGNLDGEFDADIVNKFQDLHALPMTGICDLSTWLSLLTSCGDTNRNTTACDCATILTAEKAKTLYNNGYRRVGRYLSGKISSGASKALTKEELKIAFDAGLCIFLIQQGSANSVTYFTTSQAETDVESACQHAIALGIPTGETIYFAVDCDPQDANITNYIIPYFKKVNEVMRNNYNNKYVIGIYGTRNVCTRVSNNNYAKYSFVSDMSTGYSGNMGFKIPSNWSFDQITTVSVGSGNGLIEIDKDVSSGKDLGIISGNFLTDVGQVYYSLLDMYNLAMDYTNNNQDKSNQLVLQYLRKARYGDTTLFGENVGSDADNLQWYVVAGKIDAKYCALVDSKLKGLNFDFIDSVTNESHDLPHLAATLNAIVYDILDDNYAGFNQLVDIYAGWGGDTISFAKTIKAAENNGITDYEEWAIDNICKTGYFDTKDYIDDIDAVNIGNLILSKGLSLPSAFMSYYMLHNENTKPDYTSRATVFMNYIGESAFEQLCKNMNSNEFPMSAFKIILAGKANEPKYIDAAINAFKIFIRNEIKSGR